MIIQKNRGLDFLKEIKNPLSNNMQIYYKERMNNLFTDHWERNSKRKSNCNS